MATRMNLVRVQEKGQVTLPAKARNRLGIKKGDLVSIVETEDGLLITPRVAIANKLLDRIGEELRRQGITLEELIESGREERALITREHRALGTEVE